MARLPDDRDRVDHVLATIDGALESYGDAMRWSPDPPDPYEPEVRGSPSFYSGQIGDYTGVPIMPRIAAMPIMPILRSGQSVTFDVTYSLDLEFWEDAMAQARAAFDRISLSMLTVGRSLNRLGEVLAGPGPIPPEMPEHWKRAIAAKTRRGTGPTQTPWRHRNP